MLPPVQIRHTTERPDDIDTCLDDILLWKLRSDTRTELFNQARQAARVYRKQPKHRGAWRVVHALDCLRALLNFADLDHAEEKQAAAAADEHLEAALSAGAGPKPSALPRGLAEESSRAVDEPLSPRAVDLTVDGAGTGSASADGTAADMALDAAEAEGGFTLQDATPSAMALRLQRALAGTREVRRQLKRTCEGPPTARFALLRGFARHYCKLMDEAPEDKAVKTNEEAIRAANRDDGEAPTGKWKTTWHDSLFVRAGAPRARCVGEVVGGGWGGLLSLVRSRFRALEHTHHSDGARAWGRRSAGAAGRVFITGLAHLPKAPTRAHVAAVVTGLGARRRGRQRARLAGAAACLRGR